MNISAELNECNSLSNLVTFTNELCRKVETFGGLRIYRIGYYNTESICSNDIVKRLSDIYSKTILDITFCQQANKVIENIWKLEEEGKLQLKQASIFQRFLTAIRQWLGNRGYDRHNVLYNIRHEIEQWNTEEEKKQQEKIKTEKEAEQKDEQRFGNLSMAEALSEFVTKDNPDLDANDPKQIKCKKMLSNLSMRMRACFQQKNISIIKDTFEIVKGDPEKVKWLCELICLENPAPLYLAYQLLEEFNWPSEEMKKNILSSFISSWLPLKNGIIFQTDWMDPSINYNVALIDTRKIFGSGNFLNSPRVLSDSLAEGMVSALREVGQAYIDEIKEKVAKDPELKREPLGFGIEIMQFTECRFPAAMISPLLSHLKAIPGLLSIKLQDISTGFTNEDASALLSMIDENPNLINMQIKLDEDANGLAAVKTKIDEINNNPNKMDTFKKFVAENTKSE